MSKETKYLPLYWCQNLVDQMKQFTNIEDNNDTYVRIFELVEDMQQNGKVNRNKLDKLCSILGIDNFILDLPKNYLEEFVQDIGIIPIIKQWELNKQVFKFDKDLVDELIKTDTLCFTKDAFKYLPFSTFYLDFSDNKEICDKILGNGIFISVRLNSDIWCLHLCKVTDTHYFPARISFPNETSVVPVVEDIAETRLYDWSQLDKTVCMSVTSKTIDNGLYDVVVIQLLTYLASIGADISENELTKRTYRKHVGLPKNKFSEIRSWDVGVRFGAAFRKWSKAQNQDKQTSIFRKSEAANTGRTVRPHMRRAHWQHYWYGKKDEERIRRPKWVAECMVNVDSNESLPMVIHKV